MQPVEPKLHNPTKAGKPVAMGHVPAPDEFVAVQESTAVQAGLVTL